MAPPWVRPPAVSLATPGRSEKGTELTAHHTSPPFPLVIGAVKTKPVLGVSVSNKAAACCAAAHDEGSPDNGAATPTVSGCFEHRLKTAVSISHFLASQP